MRLQNSKNNLQYNKDNAGCISNKCFKNNSDIEDI